MKADLLFASPEADSDILYASGFWAPDAFLFFRLDGKKFLFASDLEYGRAKDQSRADEVVRIGEYSKKLPKKKRKMADIAANFLREMKVKRVTVPANFPLWFAREIEKRRVKVEHKPDPFFEERMIKTEDEVRAIEKSSRVAEAGTQMIIDIIKAAEVRGRDLHYKGEPLTSEYLKRELCMYFAGEGFNPSHPIIAGGNQACDPHNTGTGQLHANEPIVLDIFPRSLHTFYWTDMTRTVIKGKPTPKQQLLYEMVFQTQKMGCEMIRPGVNGKKIHKAIQKVFDENGFKTENRDGKMVGFIHGTGHGVGLDIHEPPRISIVDAKLKEGMVVTVEPGLYYPGTGGVRIEDTVLVTNTGGRILTELPKIFQI